MSIDRRQSLNNITKSIKKFIVDGMVSDLDLKVLFGLAYTNTPQQYGKDAVRWLCVEYGDLFVNGYLANYSFNLFMYYRNDEEYVGLLKLRDSVVDYFYDYSASIPNISIPLYDVNDWSIIGHMRTNLGYETGASLLSDNTASKAIRVGLMWAVK